MFGETTTRESSTPRSQCDQIIEAIFYAYLKQDLDAKVACETATKTGMIMICGEITGMDYRTFQINALTRVPV